MRQEALVRQFLSNFAVDDIMRRTVEQCPADVILGPSARILVDLEYADDVVIFTSSSAKLQHIDNLISKLAEAYGLRLRPDKYKQMWVSRRTSTRVEVNGEPIELVDEFCYLGCMLETMAASREIFSKDALKLTRHSTD
ncbi:hypothetical protein RB195_022160 [Necator americanus]|uniref:Reverse transcriptase domain-containing protein n=1 Tax=Necator americanus TaxID=51031 RepID=A0ABR1EF73_NECAM